MKIPAWDLNTVKKTKQIQNTHIFKTAWGNKTEMLICVMSDLKESTGSRAPGRDEDQDGTHGEDDNSRGTVSAALLYLYNATFSCKWWQLLWQLFMRKRTFNQGTIRQWKFSQKCIYRWLKGYRSCGTVVLTRVRAVRFWFSDSQTKAESPAF